MQKTTFRRNLQKMSTIKPVFVHLAISEYIEMRRLGFLRGFSAKKRPKKAKIG